MTDTPSDDRFSMPPIEGDEESSVDEAAGSTPVHEPAPVLPPPGLCARLLTPTGERDPDTDEPGDTEDDADDIEPDVDAAYFELADLDDLDDLDEEDQFSPELSVAPLTGVADAIDIVEQLAAQAAVAEAEPEVPSGDDLVFADAAGAMTLGDHRNEADDEADDEVDDEPETGPDDLSEFELPSYALIEGASEEAATAAPTASLPMYGGEPSADDEEILPHFLLEEAAPLDIVGAQEELRELAQKNRRKSADEAEHKPSLARTLAEIPILLIVAAVIAFLVKTFLAQAYYIPSGSMLPQLQVDDRVVVSKLAYKLHDPRRGDIIVFDDPRNGVSDETVVERTGVAKLLRKVGEGVGVVQPSTDEFIKRVIGLPGETVSGKNGFVYVNDHKLIEPYLPEGLETSDFPAQKVAPGKLWVMGDNRGGSADSRVFGQIDVDEIVGRAVVKVWPFSGLSFL